MLWSFILIPWRLGFHLLLVQVINQIGRDVAWTVKHFGNAVLRVLVLRVKNRNLVPRVKNRNLVPRRKVRTFKRRVIVALLVHRFVKALSPTKPPPKLGTFACHLPTSRMNHYCQQKFSLLFLVHCNSAVVTI